MLEAPSLRRGAIGNEKSAWRLKFRALPPGGRPKSLPKPGAFADTYLIAVPQMFSNERFGPFSPFEIKGGRGPGSCSHVGIVQYF